MNLGDILELILIGARIFHSERERYYNKKVLKILTRIHEVEDSEFYQKDMEAKGMAQRELILEIDNLKDEIIREASES